MRYATAEAIKDILEPPVEGDWGAPDRSFLDEGLTAAPAMPTDLFGAWEPWLVGFARSVSAPVDYACAALLAAASACVGGVRKVSPWSPWAEYPATWTLMVGNPSASKSPVYSPFICVLKDLERELAEGFDDCRRRFETVKRTAQEERERWERSVGEAVKANRPSPIKPKEADDPDEPKPPRMVVSDATIESLAPIFKANPRGVTLARDELSGWVGNFGRYGGDGEAGFYLERFTGMPITVDRVKAGHIHAERALLSIFGGIQPERLTELLLKRADDGLVARFLPFFPDAVRRRRPAEAVDMGVLTRALRRLRGLDFAADDEGNAVPLTVTLTPDAVMVFDPWWTANGEAANDASGFRQGFLGKGPGMVLRLALLLELLEWAAAPGAPEPREVGEVAIISAIALFDDYFVGMAARVFGGAGRSTEDMVAASLLRHIRQSGQTIVNARDLQRCKLPGLRKADDVNTALSALREGGWSRFEGGRESDGPGRQRADWAINPKLWEARS